MSSAPPLPPMKPTKISSPAQLPMRHWRLQRGGREVQRKQWLALATNPPGANPANTLDQTDEDILTPTVSDEALEAAAGTEVGTTLYPWDGPTVFANACC